MGFGMDKWDVLAGQFLNSAIVAGIASVSLLAGQRAVDWRVVGTAFGLTFLIELRRYRGLNGK